MLKTFWTYTIRNQTFHYLNEEKTAAVVVAEVAMVFGHE